MDSGPFLGGRGPFRAGRSRIGRSDGRHGSDYGGMSSENGSEKLPRRKPKVSWARHILPGLGGPKVRLKGVADG